MCDPVTGLILAASAAGGQAFVQDRNLKKQDKIAAQGILKQGESQAEANQRVLQQINDIGANTGEEERANSLADFQAALRAGRGGTQGSLQTVAGANPRFAESVESGRAQLQNRGDEMAERLSTIEGILRQRMNEQLDVGQTQADLRGIEANSAADDFLTRLRIQGQQVNPWVSAALDFVKGAGTGAALKAPKVTPTGGAPAIVGVNAPIGGAGAVNPFFTPSFKR